MIQLGIIFNLISNMLLAGYPILASIFNNISPYLQTIIRMMVISIMCIPFITTSKFEVSLIGLGLSFLNILHIYGSTVAFQNMPIGIAIGTFYIYPILACIIHGNIHVKSLLWMFICLLGVFIINMDNFNNSKHIEYFVNNENKLDMNEINNDIKEHYIDKEIENKKQNYKYGFIFMLIAALSEALIIVYHKKSKNTPINNLFTLNIYGGILITLIYLFNKSDKLNTIINPNSTLGSTLNYELDNLSNKLDNQQNNIIDKNSLIKFILGVIVFGFIGYYSRMKSISLLKIHTSTGYSYIQIIFAFIYGYLILGQKITIKHIIGSILIIFGVLKIQI
jgi:drug/metabolite transporter (DMT)-like permease